MPEIIFYITGPDGSGKSSCIKEIESYFLKKGISCKMVWLRSPKILSKPLMLLCRMTGLTKYSVKDGIKYGGHYFYKSGFVSFLYPVLQVIDFKIKEFFLQRNFRKYQVIIFDRYSLDTLVDIMVATRKFNFHKSVLGRILIKSIPANTDIVVLQVNEDTIRERKLDTRYDPNLGLKIEVYRILAKDLGLELLNNNGEFEITFKKILGKYLIQV